MADYGQFCTVARGAEIFGELWTPLVVRELLCGSRRFNDIRRGVPRMSQTLLAKRLRKLEEVGVIERQRGADGWEYHVTPAGEELRPIVVGLGHWGARWIGSRLKKEQLDAGFLMWDIRRFAASRRSPGKAHRRPVPLWRCAPPGARMVAGGREGRRRPVPRRSRPRARRRGRIHGARAHRDLDRRQRSAEGDRRRPLAVDGGGRGGAALWRWLGRSMFAPSRLAVRPA
jgi:DNA-binding HxlR family transcriptional regulator